MRGIFFSRAVPAVLVTFLVMASAVAGPVSASASSPMSATVQAPAPVLASPPATAPRGAAMAAIAAASLQRMYNPSTGLFCRKPNANCWWDSANELTALVDYSRQAGSRTYLGDLARTYVRAEYAGPTGRLRGPFTDNWFDDDGWWALAWLDAYEWQPRETRYLTVAENLFGYIFKHGWSTRTCGGGVWQNSVRDGKNAIANGLYLELAARLYLITRHSAYLTKAQNEWRWFMSSGMIDVIPGSADRTDPLHGGELVYDRVSRACVVRGGGFWTYNQGVFVGGLDDMYRATGNRTYLSQAEAIAHCVTSLACGGNTKYANPPVDVGGILTEPCKTPDCGGTRNRPSMLQYKGVFMRNLYCLNQTVRSSAYQTFIADNARSIFAHDQNSMHQFGFSWASRWDARNGATEATEGSALSGLNANIGGKSPASC